MDDETRRFALEVDQRLREHEAKLFALRYMVANAHATLYQLTGFPAESVKGHHAMVRSALADLSYPQLDPASSDAWAAELQAAVDEILKMTEQLVGPRGT